MTDMQKRLNSIKNKIAGSTQNKVNIWEALDPSEAEAYKLEAKIQAKEKSLSIGDDIYTTDMKSLEQDLVVGIAQKGIMHPKYKKELLSQWEHFETHRFISDINQDDFATGVALQRDVDKENSLQENNFQLPPVNNSADVLDGLDYFELDAYKLEAKIQIEKIQLFDYGFLIKNKNELSEQNLTAFNAQKGLENSKYKEQLTSQRNVCRMSNVYNEDGFIQGIVWQRHINEEKNKSKTNQKNNIQMPKRGGLGE